jgi:hypothetical protein
MDILTLCRYHRRSYLPTYCNNNIDILLIGSSFTSRQANNALLYRHAIAASYFIIATFSLLA